MLVERAYGKDDTIYFRAAKIIFSINRLPKLDFPYII